ncbi:MAG: tRNA 2-thiouridine(34) synthase MnmA [Clostridia bacterium]|nr:tRNA 2-thiouridine(34) synthase MnmA [Clostridia bacterium]
MDRYLVAMSGGVDSSVAALIISSSGYECYGVTMKLHTSKDIWGDGCTTTEDIEDARRVCAGLGIPYSVVDFSDDFEKYVISDFISAYENGATPNPCIECNYHLKFDKLFSYGKEHGYGKIVTGHYARIEYDERYGRRVLKKAVDVSKDQSYVLFRLTKEQLDSTLFPLGKYSKDEIRAMADKAELGIGGKKDSQDICFIPDGDYVRFIENYTKKSYPCGNFVTKDGRILGRHKGIIGYTIGQRKGLGLALPHSMYVTEKRLDTNEVVIGESEDLFSKELYANDINLSAIDFIDTPLRIKAKVRYNQREQDATATIENGLLHVVFDEPQRAICKGQSVVLYDGDTVIGGGRIV